MIIYIVHLGQFVQRIVLLCLFIVIAFHLQQMLKLVPKQIYFTVFWRKLFIGMFFLFTWQFHGKISKRFTVLFYVKLKPILNGQCSIT